MLWPALSISSVSPSEALIFLVGRTFKLLQDLRCGMLICCAGVHKQSPERCPASADLVQARYMDDQAFIGYLRYLLYWHQPQYAKYIMYAIRPADCSVH